MSYSYELKDFDAGGRIGLMKLGSKILETPNLFPVVSPFENTISPSLLYSEFKAQALFTNAYIIYKNLNRNPNILENGLHKHLDFPGIIATDSGGFQDYMYAGEVKISPDEIEPFQEKLGSDCPVILDIPVQTTDSYEEAKRKVDITIQRAHENIKRRQRNDTAWFGPIHGSIYPDLLKHSAQEMSKLDFGIYAIGGVVKTFMDYRFELDVSILLEVRKYLTPTRPLHMFGLGLPSFFSLAVACGADTFDSAAYILYAKDGRYFSHLGTKNINDLVEFPCNCPICSKYTPKEVQQTEKSQKIQLLASHNLYFSFAELKTIRQSIREGNLWDLVEQRVQAHPKLVDAFGVIKKHPEYFLKLINSNKVKGLKESNFQLNYRPEIQQTLGKLANFKISQEKTKIICLPELDLPSKSSPMVSNWIEKIIHSPSFNQTQIFIISNLFGGVPFELSEIYPIHQHESLQKRKRNEDLTKILMNNMFTIIRPRLNKINSIYFLVPDRYQNQFNEEVSFEKEFHLIAKLPSLLKENFPSISFKESASLEEILKE